MIHCGHPVQYTSINSPYWQSHFMDLDDGKEKAGVTAVRKGESDEKS